MESPGRGIFGGHQPRHNATVAAVRLSNCQPS
jgi:hypothetical protein